MTMPIIVAAQQKGGVGKTTVVCNLACQAFAKGKTAAILDMDSGQASASKWGARRQAAGLSGVEVHPVNAAGLAGKVAELKASGVDWIFIDLPGRDAPASSAGLRIADMALVPCRPLEDDIEPSIATVGLIRRGGGRYAYLMNIAPPQVSASRAKKVAAVLSDAGHTVCPVIVVQRIGVPDANAGGMGANEREPSGQSAAEYADLFTWIEKELAQ